MTQPDPATRPAASGRRRTTCAGWLAARTARISTLRHLVAAVGLVLALAASAAAQGSHLLVVVGLAGDPANGDLFHGWATALVDAARDRYGLPAESIVYLGEDPARDAARIDGRATREGLEAAVSGLAARARPGDRVFVVLIGHGASAAGEPKFSLPGPDLSAKDFARLLDRFPAQTITFVNTTSSSGGFVATLSGRDRTVIAATRTDGERNQTRFGEFFVEALATADGDLDKDGRVSMFEAFAWAQRRVAESYKKDGQLQTEHAVLDDDGDGKGSDQPGQPGADGALARTLFLTAGTGDAAAAGATADPELRALLDQRRALEERLAALRAAKEGMDTSQYERELEHLAVELAKTNRAIRDKEKK